MSLAIWYCMLVIHATLAIETPSRKKKKKLRHYSHPTHSFSLVPVYFSFEPARRHRDKIINQSAD